MTKIESYNRPAQSAVAGSTFIRNADALLQQPLDLDAAIKDKFKQLGSK